MKHPSKPCGKAPAIANYAIAKYFSLRHLGVSSDKLRHHLRKGVEPESRAHGADLLLQPDVDLDWLDDLIDVIRPASQRKGLAAGLLFQCEGVVVTGCQG